MRGWVRYLVLVDTPNRGRKRGRRPARGLDDATGLDLRVALAYARRLRRHGYRVALAAGW
jgi:hypothetical protein